MVRSLARAQLPSTLLSCLLVAALVVSALSLRAWPAKLLLLAVLAGVALLVLLVLPVRVLPTLALASIVAIPDRVADVVVSPVVTPATVALGVWLVRRMLDRSATGGLPSTPVDHGGAARRSLVALVVLFSVLLVVLTVVSPSRLYSLSWSVTFLVAVTGPLLIGDTSEETRLLSRTLPWFAAVAAGYALVESILQRNPVYAPIYAALGKPDVQHWAVYRSDGSLGHPLLAGLFFSVALAFCVGRWLETRRPVFVVPAVLTGFGVVATVSRGAYASTAVAVAVLLLVAVGVDRHSRARSAVVLLTFSAVAFFALNAARFTQRGDSGEAQESAESRVALPQIALQTARAGHWLGGGPSASETLAKPYNFQGLPIENSYLQLLISVGLPGLLIMIAILLLSAVLAVRHRNLAALAALVAYATAISGFAALDTRRNLVVLLGVLILLCVRERAAGRPRPALARSGPA